MASNAPISLFVATPVHSDVSIHYFKACLEFQKECFIRKIPVMFQVMKSSLVTQGRQLCVSGFMGTKATHLLFIDSDISFNYRMVERMLNYDKDICLVPYPIKGLDFDKIKTRIKEGSPLDARLLGNQYTMAVPDPNNVKMHLSQIQHPQMKHSNLEQPCEPYRGRCHLPQTRYYHVLHATQLTSHRVTKQAKCPLFGHRLLVLNSRKPF
jgi:hypothetical protein